MPGTPHISDLEHHAGYWLRAVSNHVSHAFMLKVEARGITVAEWVVLRRMFDEPSISPSRLAAHLGMTRGAISKLADRLCRKGLAARTPAGTDRRSHTLTLTAQGRRLVPIVAAIADANDHDMFGHLAAQDRAHLTRILQNIVRQHGWKDTPVT